MVSNLEEGRAAFDCERFRPCKIRAIVFVIYLDSDDSDFDVQNAHSNMNMGKYVVLWLQGQVRR
jgi:hypothetical protein